MRIATFILINLAIMLGVLIGILSGNAEILRLLNEGVQCK